MSGTVRPVLEKLYLYKGKDEDDDIFIESTLHQHHIDGIRFLYKQFKKKKPGVVVNNPLGYGNSMQVALFLGAVRHMLNKPILILCEEGEEYNWFEHFQKLTQCYNGRTALEYFMCETLVQPVAVNAPNPLAKKSIFINTMEKAETFTRRPWGVLVIDNDNFLKAKTLHSKFQADFKIWITPVDMKEDLQTLSSIYKWIFPKEKFDADEFKSIPGDRKDAISKAILLRTFLENIVFRTTLLTPFENPYKKKVLSSEKVSKKNKDVTGTKIKRSKRVAEEMTPDNTNTKPHLSAVKILKLNHSKTIVIANSSNSSVSNISTSNTQSVNKNGELMEVEDNKCSDLDIESFISNKEPIKGDDFKGYSLDFDNISNDSQEGKLALHYESDSMLDERVEHKDNSIDSVSDSERSLSKTLGRTPEMSPESDDNAYQLETQELLDDNTANETNNYNYFINELNEMDESASKDSYKNPWVNKTKSFECKQTELENNDNNINIENEIKNNYQDGVDASHETDMQKETDNSDNINKINNNHEKVNGSVAKTGESLNDQNENKKKAVDIDSKISEHENRIFKKFKGTFLDKLF